MAIVMLASFDPEELPGVHYSQLFPLMDIGSYREAWNAVRHVASNCISPFLTTNRTIVPELGAPNFISETGYSNFGMSLPLVKSASFLIALLTIDMRYRAERRYWCISVGYRFHHLPRDACCRLLFYGQ